MSQKTAFYVLSLIVIFFIGYYYAKINLGSLENNIDSTNTTLSENILKEELSKAIENKNNLQTQHGTPEYYFLPKVVSGYQQNSHLERSSSFAFRH